MSDNALTVREEITESKIIEYLDSAGITNSLLQNEKKMFFNIAREFHLNPFKREIHITAYGQGDKRKCSIITGYDVYIKRAERTGKLDGWKVWTEGEGKAMKAIIEIYRKDQKYPFVHEVYYSECCQYNAQGQPNAVWAKQPRFMTKKVAIGQGFRLCFPDDLGGMPYEESELPNEEPRNVTEPQQKPEPEETHNVTEPKENSKKPEQRKTERQKVIDEIVVVFKAITPDGTDFFTKEEKDGVKAKIAETKEIEELKEIASISEKELEKRKAEYKDIPWGDV